MKSYVAHVTLDISFDTKIDPYEYFSEYYSTIDDWLVEYMGTVEIERDYYNEK